MSEEKVKFALRMMPEEQEMVQEWAHKSGCRSQNEFIRRAIRFYAGYLSSENGEEYLSAALTKAVTRPLREAEERIARLLFKLAVEDSMVVRVLAAAIEVDEGTLHRLRGECVKDVKESHGAITLREAEQMERENPLPRDDDIPDDW